MSNLLFLLLKDETFLNLQDVGPYESQSQLFEELFKKFLKKYIFALDMDNRYYIPSLIRKLCKLKQWRSIQTYLDGLIETQTLALEFVQAYVAA